MTLYPQALDELNQPFATERDRDQAINALQRRVGIAKDRDPGCIEDRLYQVEMLMLDVLTRLEKPPGQVKKWD